MPTLKELKQQKAEREAAKAKALAASQANELKLIRITLFEGFKQRDAITFEKAATESIDYAISKEINDDRDSDWYDVQLFHPDDEDEEMKYMWITCISQDGVDKQPRNFPPAFVERFVGRNILLYPEQPGNLFFKEQVSCVLEAASA